MTIQIKEGSASRNATSDELAQIRTDIGAAAADHTHADLAASGHTHSAAGVTDFVEAVQDVVGALVVAAGGGYDDTANAISLPSSGSATPVVDNLASNSATSALSANQGRVLAEQVATKATPLAPVDINDATVLTYAEHANRQLRYSGADSTKAIPANAGTDDAAWSFVELAGSAGHLTVTTPDGKSVVTSPTKVVGFERKGLDVYTAGTTDPTTGVATGAEITAALDAHLAGTAWRDAPPAQLTGAEIIAAINAALGSANWQGGTGAPAVVTSAAFNTANQLTVTFSSPLTSANPTGSNIFVLGASGGALVASNIVISGNTVTADTQRNVAYGETITLAYVPGNATPPLANAAGDVAGFTDYVVTNNIAAPAGTPFDLTFGRNVTVNPDDYTMSSRNGDQGSPTTAGQVEPSSYEVNNSGTGNFAAVRAMVSAASLGTNVVLTTAELRVRTAVDGSYIDGVFSVYPCLREWVAGQMNYNEWATGQAWGTAGATNASDRGTTPLGTLAFTAAQDDTELVIPLDAAAVQNMINAGGDIEMLLFSSGYFAFAVADGVRPSLRLVGTSTGV